MKRLSRTLLIALILSMPLAVFAAAPQNVTGIRASLENGRVVVTWDQTNDPDISFYRIFHSSVSILENDGVYDDFEFVDGSVNRHTLQSNPAGPNVFVSVLAVNRNGEESPYFVEEASVALGGAPTTSSVASSQPSSRAGTASSAAQSQPAVTSENLRLLSAQAVSSTGVLLTFSHTVIVPPSVAATAFTVATASGVQLPLVRLVVQDKTITIHTVTQERGTVYRLTASAGLQGKDRNGNVISFNPEGTPLLFSGHPTGKLPSTPSSSVASVASVGSTTASSVSSAATTAGEVASLHLRAVPDGAVYTVEATWQPRDTSTVAGYLISQTLDKGQTFAAPQPVAKESTGVNIPRVTPGEFGLRVQIVYSNGSVSNGVTQLVTLPAVPSTPPVQGSVIPSDQPSTPAPSVPSTGVGIGTVMAMTGAIAGWRRMKRFERSKV